MAYKPIINGAPDLPKVGKMVHRIEGYYLKPAHVLMRLPTPELDDPCSFVIAQALLAAIAGASTTLYNARKGDRHQFVGLMVEYYPWDREPDPGVRSLDVAMYLYQHFRNPLTHNAGAHIRYAPAMEPKIMGSATGRSEEDISMLETADTFKPITPLLTMPPKKAPVLRLKNLYWGTRILMERLTSHRPRMISAEAKLPDNV